MAQAGILGSQAIERAQQGAKVRVAGLVLVHQSPPTAKGFHFVTLEDEDGFLNVIVSPAVYTRYRRVIRECPLLIIEGEVQHETGVTNVIARTVTRLD